MNYFKAFKVPMKFRFKKSDRDILENVYLESQKKSNLQEGVINFNSTYINKAYNTLLDDFSRCSYIMKFLGITKEEAIIYSNIEDIMRIHEELEECESEEKRQDRIQSLEKDLDTIYDKMDHILLQMQDNHSDWLKEKLKAYFVDFSFIYEIIKKYKKNFIRDVKS